MPSGSQVAGTVAGLLGAPLSAGVSLMRRGRALHPRGEVYLARVSADAAQEAESRIAARLAGPALVRVSAAIWRRREWKDILGIALRFRSTPDASPAAAPEDQDLLFATVKHPWTLPFAPFSTNTHDFLANDYYSVSPFADPDLGLVRFRLRSAKSSSAGADRWRRLRDAARRGSAVFVLEATNRWLGWGGWRRIATLELTRPVVIDQDELRFSPSRTGRGIVPRGFIHALRPPAYGGSQAIRALNPKRGKATVQRARARESM